MLCIMCGEPFIHGLTCKNCGFNYSKAATLSSLFELDVTTINGTIANQSQPLEHRTPLDGINPERVDADNRQTYANKNLHYSLPKEEKENPEQVVDLAGARDVDLRYDLTISLEESVFGVEKQIEFIRKVACAACGGSGALDADRVACPTCKGARRDRAFSRFFTKEPSKHGALCKTCYGSGTVPVAKCSACRGLGRCNSHESKKITVPPGINTGQSIVLIGMGNVKYNFGANGDLYVSFRISHHDKYTRDGFDLYADLPVPASLAASGGEIIYETLRDTVKFRMPQGVEDGQLLRLKKQGVPRLDATGVGDLLLKVRIT